MNKVLFAALLFFVPFLPPSAHASSYTIAAIDRSLQITNVEMQAIYSGRYHSYRPETIRNILSQLSQEATSALQTSESSEARKDLSDLLRSLQEEFSYSYRFQIYRLESTRLLMLNYQRFLTQARQSEQIHGSQGYPAFGGCGGPARVGCL